MMGVGWASKRGGGTRSEEDGQDANTRGGTLLQDYSASAVAATTSAVAAATMTTRDDCAGRIDNDNGGDQASTLPKKKSVRWGAITEHHHDSVTATETPKVINAGSHVDSMNDRHPKALSHPHLQQQRQQQHQKITENPALPKYSKKGRGNQSKCRLPGHSSHIWKECPNNPHSRNYCGIDHRTMNYSSHLQLSSLSSPRGSLTGSAASRQGNIAVAMTSDATDAAPPVLTNGKERPSTSSSTIPRKRLPPTVLPSSSKKTRLEPSPPSMLSSLVRSVTATTAAARAGGSATNHLFNTTDSARPIPRKANVRAMATMHPPPSSKNPAAISSLRNSSFGVPRKDKGTLKQLQPQQQRSQPRQQETTPQLGQRTDVTNVNGQWRRRPAIRAPSGTDAQALRKHTSTRLLVGASRKVNKEKGDSEVGGVGGDDDNEDDAIANGSGMIEFQQVARTDDGRGGGRGNGDDGRFMQRTGDGSSVRGSLEGLLLPSSSTSGAGIDIRMTDDNNDNVDLSISLRINGPVHYEAGEEFAKDKSCSGEDITAFASSSENDNNGSNMMMKSNSATSSERVVPNKAARIGLGLSAATSSSALVGEANEQTLLSRDNDVTGDADCNDGDQDNGNNDYHCENYTDVENYENKTESEIADEMEQDLINLVEMSISLSEQWAKKIGEDYDDDDANELESNGDDGDINRHAGESFATSPAQAGATSIPCEGGGWPASCAGEPRAEELPDGGGQEEFLPSSSSVERPLQLIDSSISNAIVAARTQYQQQRRHYQHILPFVEGVETAQALVHAICDGGGKQGSLVDVGTAMGVLATGEVVEIGRASPFGLAAPRQRRNMAPSLEYPPASEISGIASLLPASRAAEAAVAENEPISEVPTAVDSSIPVDINDILLRNHYGQKFTTQNNTITAVGAVDNEDGQSQKENIGNGQVHHAPFSWEEGHTLSSLLSKTSSAEIESPLLVNEVSENQNMIALIISPPQQQQQQKSKKKDNNEKRMIATTDGSPPCSKKPRKRDAVDSSSSSFGHGDDLRDDGFNNAKLLASRPDNLPPSLPPQASNKEQEQLRGESTVPMSLREEREGLLPSSSVEQRTRGRQEWPCMQCTFLNLSWRTECVACGMSRHFGFLNVDHCGSSLKKSANELMAISKQQLNIDKANGFCDVHHQEGSASSLQESNYTEGSDESSRNSRNCHRSDLDDNVPAFLTCKKCSMVFADANEAQEHEIKCTITNYDDVTRIMQEGRVFYDKGSLLRHMGAHWLQMGKIVNEEDKIYFRPVSPYESDECQIRSNYHSSVVEESIGCDRHSLLRSGSAQSSPADDSDVVEADDSDVVEEIGGDENGENNEYEEEWGNDGKTSEVEATEMNLVNHLCSTTVDPATGLPTQNLTVICGDTETLYDFRVDIKTSSIFNAGYGAFLTYLGARLLKKSALVRSTRLMQEHIARVDVGTLQPLVAQTIGGRRMSVRISGKNLHYNDNNIYWSKKLFSEFAEFRKKNPIEGKSRSTNESFDESNVDCHIHHEVKMLRDKIPPGQGIGFLGIFSESDYKSDNSQLFWSYPNGIFQLGRYGPHRPEDRKKLLHFNFKNFIHNYEPSEWSYDVPEPLQNRMQMVDITDDATGKVHALARAHTPIYVNEVGHNPNLHSNVLILEKNDQSVYYYIAIDQKHAMKKGDTVELLVDYGDAYEEVREIKGYGRDKTFDPIQRNLDEREELENDIRTLSVYEMFDLVQFLTKNIFDPINKSIKRYCTVEGTEISDFPCEKDLIAMRRLHWLAGKLMERVREYLTDSAADALSYIRHVTQEWRLSILRQGCNTRALQNEISEENLYQARPPSLADGGLTCHRRRSKWSRKDKIPDNNFPGWFLMIVPRRKPGGVKEDKYWYHPQLPGVVVRSTKGVSVMVDFMSAKGVGVKEAYKRFMGQSKYFAKKSPG